MPPSSLTFLILTTRLGVARYSFMRLMRSVPPASTSAPHMDLGRLQIYRRDHDLHRHQPHHPDDPRLGVDANLSSLDPAHAGRHEAARILGIVLAHFRDGRRAELGAGRFPGHAL